MLGYINLLLVCKYIILKIRKPIQNINFYSELTFSETYFPPTGKQFICTSFNVYLYLLKLNDNKYNENIKNKI